MNADEGEPGTIKDRYVMELRPHLLLEAVVLAMRVLDAAEGWIYLREEYATARNTLLQGISEFRGRAAGGPHARAWSSAPAPTSPARRRRCSSRWRGAARCRA